MRPGSRGPVFAWLLLCGAILWLAGPAGTACRAQPPAVQANPAEEGCLQPRARYDASAPSPVEFIAPAANSGLRPFPINLPTALRLGNSRAIDIQAAAARLGVAVALLKQAQVTWLPSVTFGGDYFRHEGLVQNSAGAVMDDHYQSLMLGAGSGIGSTAVISLTDAFFAPLAARQVVRARGGEMQTATNDSLVAVTEAYFTIQQARGELAGAIDATRRAEDLVRRTSKLAPGLVPPVEAVRAEAELSRRQQTEVLARERWRVGSAELIRVLRLDPTVQVDPVEPPYLRVTLVPLDTPLDNLIPVALTLRPELASRQAFVQASLQLLRQERLRPLIPSLLVRGVSTPASGTLAAGYAAAGTGSLNNVGGRVDVDVQLLWQLDNLGFGNYARVQQRRAENQQAMVELFRIEDRVAAEVSEALAQAQSAADRVGMAERGLRLSVESAEKNLAGVGQTQRSGELVTLVIRPQEAVASVQALAQAYADYFGAIADDNRAQFRLYRALGKPAQMLLGDDPNYGLTPLPEGVAPTLPPPRPLVSPP
jgi:outer membrane protein TolC